MQSRPEGKPSTQATLALLRLPHRHQRGLQAVMAPSAPLQAQYLRDLNRSGQHESVIQLFESGRLAGSEEVFAQYVRALAKADRLSGTALMQTLHRGAQSYMGAAAPAAHMAPAMSSAAAAPSFAAQPMAMAGLAGSAAAAEGGAAAGAALGSAKNPIYMMQVRCCCCLGKWGPRLVGWWPSASQWPSCARHATYAGPCAVDVVCRLPCVQLRMHRCRLTCPPSLHDGTCHSPCQGCGAECRRQVPTACLSGPLGCPSPQAEPTFWSQLWRSVRMLGLAFLFMAGLGAMVEERGLRCDACSAMSAPRRRAGGASVAIAAAAHAS